MSRVAVSFLRLCTDLGLGAEQGSAVARWHNTHLQEVVPVDVRKLREKVDKYKASTAPLFCLLYADCLLTGTQSHHYITQRDLLNTRSRRR